MSKKEKKERKARAMKRLLNLEMHFVMAVGAIYDSLASDDKDKVDPIMESFFKGAKANGSRVDDAIKMVTAIVNREEQIDE